LRAGQNRQFLAARRRDVANGVIHGHLVSRIWNRAAQ
jgi:hypothetical protein